MKSQDLDCIIISSGELASDTERCNWDKMSSGWYAYYGWHWARIGSNYYSLDNLLNYVKNERLPSSPLKVSPDEFNHFAIPQLSGVYLLNYLRAHGFSAELVNCLDLDQERFLALLKKKPRCVAISTTFHLSPFSLRKVVAFIRSHYPEGKVVLGGGYLFIQAKYGQKRILKNIYQSVKPDYCIIEAQGEETLGTLLGTLREELPIDSIKNLLYRKGNGDVVFTGTSPENNNLDTHYIRWSAIEDEVLGPTINMRTSRSCPFRCSYCTFPQLMGDYSSKSLETLRKEFDEVSKKSYIRNLIFIDDTLNTSKARLLDICGILRGFEFSWYAFLRCEKLDTETVAQMKESGCKGVYMGLESGDDQILKNMNKRMCVDDYKRGLELLAQHGIVTFGSFMLGFPGETDQSVQRTLDLIENYGLDFYVLNGWTYFTFAPIHKRREEFGITGRMNEWRHNTMDSLQTAKYCKESFFRIRNSVFMPANTASGEMWSVINLLDRGFSLEEAKDIYRIYRDFVELNLREGMSPGTIEDEREKLIGRLTGLLQGPEHPVKGEGKQVM